MNWNFSTQHFHVRLPVNDQDGLSLFTLLNDQARTAHIPSMALDTPSQAEDELKRMTLRFENREAAYWLVEDQDTQAVIARIGVQHINWMMLNAQLQWELSDQCDQAVLDEVMPGILSILFEDLNLHRLEMRLAAGNQVHTEKLQALGFEKEGLLPMQMEYQGQDVSLEVYSLLHQ